MLKKVQHGQFLKGSYNVILADPPWQYRNKIRKWGPAELHYSTMSTKDICALEIPADDNAVLFLWVTNPFLEDALKVVEAWDFEYKTNMVWVKTNLKRPGSGFYVRGRHELLYICIRGSFDPKQLNDGPINSVIKADVREHSQKPEVVYEIIEKMYPKCKYLELFCSKREERDERHGAYLVRMLGIA